MITELNKIVKRMYAGFSGFKEPAMAESYVLKTYLGLRICLMRDRIRYHRNQKGDDRCWLDDYSVWELLPDSPPMPSFSLEEGMRNCRAFWAFRRAEFPDIMPPDATLDSNLWDDDLTKMSAEELAEEFIRLCRAIRGHRDVNGRPRTTSDDRALYAVLPEKVPADFRLPPEEEFLGEAKAPNAGCPAFWRSHAGCAQCNLHRWGPCT
jgi:hypothetical protein